MTALELFWTQKLEPKDVELRIARLRDLESVRISAPNAVSPAAMEILGQNKELSTLAVSGSAIGDSELASLRSLAKLDYLYLGATGISDAGLGHLQGLKRLRSLFLGKTRVGDSGLDKLSTLSSLTHIDLHATSITDDGLQHLQAMPGLRILQMDDCNITDSGLAKLSSHVSLTDLGLRGTGITDTGLLQLRGLVNLTTLHLGGTKVTPAGADELRKFLPALKTITFDSVAKDSSAIPQPSAAYDPVAMAEKLEQSILPSLVRVKDATEGPMPIGVVTEYGVCTILPEAALSVELVTLDGKRKFPGTVVSRKPFPFCWIDCQELNLRPVKFAESEAIAKPQNAFVALHRNGSVKLHPGSNASGGTFSSPASFGSQQSGIVFLGPVFAADGSCLGLGVRSDPKHAFKIYPLQRD